MKYAIIVCVNGSFLVKAEGLTLESAKVQFHGICQTYWNAPDVARAEVMIVDEQLDCPEGYKEFIKHDVVTSAAPEVVEGE